MSEVRKHFTPQEKVALLKRHLLEKVPVSELCQQAGIQPRRNAQVVEIVGAGEQQPQNHQHKKPVTLRQDKVQCKWFFGND